MTATDVRTVQEQGILYSERWRVFVLASEDGVVALSAISPHRPEIGERVLYCEPGDYFVAQHGELFDEQGRYVDGPAPRGLDRVPVRLVADTVQIKPGETAPGPPREDAGELRSGPRCAGDPLVETRPGFTDGS